VKYILAKLDEQRSSILRGITALGSDGSKTAFDSVHVNLESHANVIDESDSRSLSAKVTASNAESSRVVTQVSQCHMNSKYSHSLNST
jgi:hypothetical protein